MNNIDELIHHYNSLTKKELDIKSCNFLDSIIEDYMVSNYMNLKNAVNIPTHDKILLLATYSFVNIHNINKKYGRELTKIFENKITEYFQTPNNVKFNVDEESEPEQEIDKEDVDEIDDYSEILRDELNHQHIKNALINGGALYKFYDILDLVKPELDKIDKDIYSSSKFFMMLAELQKYIFLPARDSNMQVVGQEKLDIKMNEDNKKIINIDIISPNYLITSVEMIKGILDLFSEHSFPHHLYEYEQKYIRKISSDYYFEQWAWLYGKKLYEIHIESRYDKDEPYHMYLYKIFKKNYKDLLFFMENEW